MATRSEAALARWSKVSTEDRAKLMSERKRKGDVGRTPESRKLHASIASKARWAKSKTVDNSLIVDNSQ